MLHKSYDIMFIFFTCMVQHDIRWNR